VEYQQALQTVSDPLLGWTTVGEHQYYVRQFRDMKGAIVVEGISAGALADYAGVCGYLLAKSHARTSGASMIAGYIGGSDKLDECCAGSPAGTPTRSRPTTRRWWTRCAGACCRRNRPDERGHRARFKPAARLLGRAAPGAP